MGTYAVTVILLGRRRTIEVWASSTSAARSIVAATYPAAVIESARKRQAF